MAQIVKALQGRTRFDSGPLSEQQLLVDEHLQKAIIGQLTRTGCEEITIEARKPLQQPAQGVTSRGSQQQR
ncbi:hypothetical protein KTAU_30140 [Thermogemmatispora aurantia]|nr:hypothetical protein KTAU_30140 [Thermogemmatispora aurantia]